MTDDDMLDLALEEIEAFDADWLAGRTPYEAQITAPTAVFDLPEDVYHADRLLPERSLSSTMAKTILQAGGPARVREVMLNGQESKKEWEFGTAAHSIVLGRGKELVAIDGNRNANAVKAAIAEAEADGYQVVKSHELAAIQGMAEQLLRHPIAGELLTAGRGKPEVSMFDIDPVTGRWKRGRLDFLHSRKLIVDYKTTASAIPDEFSRSAWKFGYHVQRAHYHEGLAVSLDLVDPDADYVLIAQEKKPPYLVAVFRFDQELREVGAELARRALNLWDRCLELNDWPGIEPIIHTLSVPKWADFTDEEGEW